MQVLHLSVECYPVAKVGGLADVVGSLPKYQRAIGIDAAVVMPYYNREFVKKQSLEIVFSGEFYQGSELLKYEIFREKEDVLGFPLYLIKIPGKLDREEVYCYADEAEQWIAFQHAFLKWLSTWDNKPAVINCHDHHTGLIPFLLKYSEEFKSLSAIKTLFTVHNGNYQGWMNWQKGILLPKFDSWKWGLLDWDGIINPMAAAIKCTDAYSTVSEGYLEELYVDANGLQQLFLHEREKSHGIVNGIDPEYWNPQTDKLIASNYGTADFILGKKQNKEVFCAKYNLPTDGPLLTYIGRFAAEKGADLLAEVVESLLLKYEEGLSIFILGSGNDEIQKALQEVSEKFENIACYFGYNEQLAHEAYAASDMLLMPSRVEPCGLNQLYAFKYGTVPIVRGIGGLKDTVQDYISDRGTGFVFDSLEISSIVDSIERAIQLYEDKTAWAKLVQADMNLDYSWIKSAEKYKEIYNQLTK